MKILLINPAFNRYGGIRGHGGAMPPLNLCSLAAYARARNEDARFTILDAEIEGLSHEQAADTAVELAPDLIGITANTSAFDSVICLSRVLKQRLPGTPVVIGGPHPSALPARSLEETGADFVVRGEGEVTFTEVLERVRDGGGWNEVLGLAYRDGGEIRINPPRPLLQDLDALPFPARDLIPNERYAPPPSKRVSLGPTTLMVTSRGCPFDCGFCGAKTVWTQRLRMRGAESVVAEIEECVERYGIRTFNIADEFFTADGARVLAICSAILERGLDIRWVCFARASGLELETLKAMRKAGCYEISYGIESGDPDMLERIGKRIDLDEAREVIGRTKKAGIATHASYMFGYIGETEKTMRATLRFAKRLNTSVAAFFVASPLPGTRLYEEALEHGYLREDATWLDYAPLANRTPVLNLPGLDAATIRAWHRKALRTYYLRPRYMLAHLAAIRHWHDIANLAGGLRLLFRIK